MGVDGSLARSFASRFLRDRLISGAPPAGPELHRLCGAVLLTDIEGFTAHVEALADQGAAGLEELAAGFDDYFAALVAAVTARGGDVLTIAGDSLLCCWRADEPRDLATAAQLAADAGLAIQRGIARAGPAALSTRLGVAAGALTVGIAGGQGGRWELVPGGPAVAEVARTERGARAGVVTIDQRVAALLGADAEVRRGSQARIELLGMQAPVAPVVTVSTADDVGLLRPFIPAPVVYWAATGRDWLAERRPVTVLMARLEADESVAQELLLRQHLALAAFQEVMQRFEGAAKLLFDNKGLTCSGVFGLPPRAHEDDVDRGLRAARAMHEAFGRLNFGCAIGVASGHVFCGMFGSDERREYTLFGNVVNLASRLSASSAFDVLIDGTTVQSSSLILELERRPMLALKGRRGPVQVQRLVKLRSATPGSRAIVGREAERRVVSELVDVLIDVGEHAALLIEGDAGIGKTTLAQEAVKLAASRGARPLHVVADPVEGATPYGPWRRLFAEMLGRIGSRTELARRVTPGEDSTQLLPLLNAVLPIPLPDTPATAALSGEARADRTDALLASALASASDTEPLVLLVEDAHWLDTNSLALLLRVVTEVPRLLAVVTARLPVVGEQVGFRAQIRSLDHTRALTLGPLGSEDTRELVRQRLGTASVAPGLVSVIQERAAGQPFFCEALLDTMIQARAISVGDAGAELTEGAAMEIPTSIESAVLSRLDRTSPDIQLAFKAASVVGRAFTKPEVAATRGAATDLDEHLEVLCALQLLERREHDDGYAFCHRIIRDVAYALLTEGQRRPLHGGLARFYETLAPHSRASHRELLAHHWTRADEPARALPYLEEAGREALRDGGFDEAATLLEAAISMTPRGEQSRRALQEKSLADAYYFRGELLRSRALLEQALERLGEPMASGRRALAGSVARDVRTQTRQLLRPRRHRESRAGERSVLLPAIDAYRTLVQISYLHATSTLEVAHLVLAGLNLAENAGPSPELARALANAACLADIVRLEPLADRYERRAVRIAEQDEHSAAGPYVWNVLSIVRGQRGHWEAALRTNDRALELFGEVGDYNLEAELWQTRSALELCRGGLDPAEVAWTRTRELAVRTGSSVNRCWSLLDEAQTQAARGRIAGAATALEAALAIPTPGSDGGTVIERHATAALVRLGQGRNAEAVSEADAVIDMAASRVATSWVWADFCAGAVEILLTLREAGDLEFPPAGLDRRIARGLGVLRQLAFSFRGLGSRLCLLRARAARIAGDAAAAERHLECAERAATRPDQALDKARAAVVRSQWCTEPALRAELLAPALEQLRELGAKAELTRAEALLS